MIARVAGRQRLGARWPRGRLRQLRRAVDVFGFHLAALDLRQNSDVHERAIGELLGLVAARPRLRRARRGRAHRLLLAELGTARPLASPFCRYSEETAGELAILRAAARRIAATAGTRCRTT